MFSAVSHAPISDSRDGIYSCVISATLLAKCLPLIKMHLKPTESPLRHLQHAQALVIFTATFPALLANRHKSIHFHINIWQVTIFVYIYYKWTKLYLTMGFLINNLPLV